MNNVVVNYGKEQVAQTGDIYVIERTPYIHATLGSEGCRLISLADGNRWSDSDIDGKTVDEILIMIRTSVLRVAYLGQCEIEVNKK